jgi:hypothetical protein
MISRIRTQLLDLAGSLIADHLAGKDFAIERTLKVIEFIDKNDIPISDIKEQL